MVWSSISNSEQSEVLRQKVPTRIYCPTCHMATGTFILRIASWMAIGWWPSNDLFSSDSPLRENLTIRPNKRQRTWEIGQILEMASIKMVSQRLLTGIEFKFTYIFKYDSFN